MTIRAYAKAVLTIELVGFFAVLAIIWLDEFVDIPFRYFGATKTPPRPEEYWFETLSVLVLGIAVVSATVFVLWRLRYLEKFIRVCAWCRKVLVDDRWVPFEDYMKMRHDVIPTHGMCPACRENAADSPEKKIARSQPGSDSVY